MKRTHLEVLGDFTDEPLEGELADEELRRLLVPTDLTKSDGTRPETMRLLDTTSCGLENHPKDDAKTTKKSTRTAAVLRA